MQGNISRYLGGLFYALAAYTAWGIFPLYWKLLNQVPADQILAHRIIWSLVFLAVILLISKNKTCLQYFKNPAILRMLLLTSVLVGSNWFVYIFAINSNHIVEASLGYYINPLVNFALGVLFLKEKPSFVQKIAILLAFAGVAWLTVHLGRLPWISVFLAVTFALYAFFRKKANLDSISGLLIETVLLAPVALIYLAVIKYQGNMFFGHGIWIPLLLIIGGPVTALPLYWFGHATTRVPLSTLGFIQYLSPTLQLIIGILIYRETFSTSYLICFILVWTALALFTANLVYMYRKSSGISKK